MIIRQNYFQLFSWKMFRCPSFLELIVRNNCFYSKSCHHNNNFKRKLLTRYSSEVYPCVLYFSDKPTTASVSSQHVPLSGLIVQKFPESWQPYLRLMRADKPVGTLLLYWPSTWSIALCSQPGSLPNIELLTLFGLGAFFMRGAGCVVNDLWDKEFDKKVARTKDRPLANGELSVFQAFTLLGGLLSCSLAILLQLNYYSIILGTCSMVLVVTYPLFKRFTYWPQFILGMTLNWGVLMAWVIKNESFISLISCLPLYTACVCYTVIYDTIYSHQGILGIIHKVIRLNFRNFSNSQLFFGEIMREWGLTFNWGVLLGWAATSGSVYWLGAMTLYFSGISWTLVYDTIYAHQDKADDSIIGLKSTALKFGDNTKPYLSLFGSSMITSLAITGLMTDQTWPYYVGLLLTSCHIGWQIGTLDINNPADCWKKFSTNRYLGLILFTSIVASNLLK
ncbi:4-hydroxybenzoate polyprenyltransferase, mitochondrial [Trichinella pseudospiralis]|uniref:4-hydroxybenzoate polyprenyltransferase, mitochondrial n=1 Tax=Trichinella pseudospiralis TaxID=6337 RepID=A0A0V0YJ19_TRIPS|nr:4-hydroxybenzoate polyprenyltransferase, mitochondrial [Trichinella pseudospiralis]